MASSSSFQPDAASELNLTGSISGSGPLSLDGAGQLVLSGSNGYSGGTYVTAGTLIAASDTALLDGSNLTVGDASAFSPAPVVPSGVVTGSQPAASPSIAAVPEPGSLLLLAAGGLLAGLTVLRKKKKSYPK